MGAGLDGFGDGAFADLVAQTGRFEVLNDSLLSGFAFSFVDGQIPELN